MREIRLIGAYAKRSMLEWLGHRSFLTTLIFNNSIAAILGLALWSVALPDRGDVSTYFLLLLAVQWATASQEYYSITMSIYDGALNDDLLLPHAQIVRPIAEGIAYRLWNLAIGLPILALMFAVIGGRDLEASMMILAIPALILAVAVHFAFTCSLCLSALWFQQSGAITDIGSTLVVLFGGIAIPIMLMPEPARQIMAILPFRSMAGFPAELASDQMTGSQIIIGFACQGWWLLAFSLLLARLWRTGIRHYTALGG